MDLGLRGKVALVAGGSKGIGRAIALELAREGSVVVVSARGKEALDHVVSELGEHGAPATGLQADLCVPDEIARVVGQVVDGFGRLDILVNNVGDSKMNHGWSTGELEWQSMLDQSLLSAVRCSRSAIPHLQKSGSGRIINISSVNGHQPPAGRVDYNAAKAAILAWSKTLSFELAPAVTVNCVCPARIDTPLWHRMAETLVPDVGTTVDEVLHKVGQRDVPMGTFGRPEDVAGVVTFLASERAAWITGVAYNVDGGYTRSLA